MKESMPYNNNPLAQQAKKALKEMKAEIDSTQSYLLQLIRIGLQTKALCPVSNQQQADLLMALDYLDGMPERGTELIVHGPLPDEGGYVEAPKDLDLEDLILELVERLKFSLSELGAMPKRSAL